MKRPYKRSFLIQTALYSYDSPTIYRPTFANVNQGLLY
ncbi:unnamed protein product [Tenebrio molitor]|nr:unnamed protein product [Tenebrio molitor]